MRSSQRVLEQNIAEKIKGVGVLVQCKDISTKWVTLKDMKNSYTVQMAKYALQRCIAGNIEFTWWIRHVLVKSNRITGKLKSKYWV